MQKGIHTNVANRLYEISAELAKPISADAESIRRLHDIASVITSLADSIGRHENVNIADVWKNETVEGKACRYRLPVYLGVTSADDDIVVDLAQMPHLLIGGVGMSGKSNFLNSLICGLVRQRSPDDVRFVLFDPKCVEFTDYYNLPHAAFQVITDDAQCMYALLSLVREMDRRLKMFARVLCRRIDDFNNSSCGQRFCYTSLCPFSVLLYSHSSRYCPKMKSADCPYKPFSSSARFSAVAER